MANDLSPYVPEFWALETLRTLTTNNVLASLVYRDFENSPQAFGDTIHTRKPGTFVANDKSNTADTTLQDATATDYQVVLNKHKEVTFAVTDRDMATSLPNIIETQIVPAAQAISKQMDIDIYTSMAQSYFYTAGTMASVPSTLASLAAVRKVQNQKNVPFGGRNLVIGPTVEEKFIVLDAFINKNYIGNVNEDNVALTEALLGRKLGLTIFMDQNVETAIVQAAASGYVVNGVNAKGSKSLIVKTGTGAIPAGASFTLAGAAAGSYVVTAPQTSGANTWTIEPGLRAATTDSDAITLQGAAGATYYKLPFFTRNATALVVRPMLNPESMGAGVSSASVSGDGFSIRALVAYDIKALAWRITLDCLYGVAPLDTEQGGFLLS
jgi:hypothetical protein